MIRSTLDGQPGTAQVMAAKEPHSAGKDPSPSDTRHSLFISRPRRELEINNVQRLRLSLQASPHRRFWSRKGTPYRPCVCLEN